MLLQVVGGRRACDPRLLQIACLGLLLASGAWLRDFTIRPGQVALTLGAAVCAQAALRRLTGRGSAGLRSPVVTALGLTLLLRSTALWVHPLAAALAIGGKFLLRWRGKHLFNPANLGTIAALVLLPDAWVSPGQWGADIAFAAWFVALGTLVVGGARRTDVSAAFLACHFGALAARVAWLGQPPAVLVHHFGSGALLLFAFFMISDPMTIPNHRRARTLHAALVAAIAHVWQFWLYRPNALLWALFLAAPTVPLLDAVFPAAKLEWLAQPDEGGLHGVANFPRSSAGGPARALARRAA